MNNVELNRHISEAQMKVFEAQEKLLALQDEGILQSEENRQLRAAAKLQNRVKFHNHANWKCLDDGSEDGLFCSSCWSDGRLHRAQISYVEGIEVHFVCTGHSKPYCFRVPERLVKNGDLSYKRSGASDSSGDSYGAPDGGCVDGVAACRRNFNNKCSRSAIERSDVSSTKPSRRDNNRSVATILFLYLIAWAPAGAAHGAKAGQFLIAAPSSSDDDFARTVILLVHSGDESAIGLIVNRPTTVPLPALFPDLKRPGIGSAPLYQGGPMRIGINGLVRSRTKPERASEVMPGVYLVSDRSQLKKITETKPASVRVYVGLCGWSAAQLRNELANRLWSIAPATAGTIFDKQPASLWFRLAAKAKIKK